MIAALARRLAAPAGRQAAPACVAALFNLTLALPARAIDASSAPAPVSPILAASLAPAPSAEGSSRSLPRQFSVEVGAGGALVADGMRLGAAPELERWAQRALSAARFSGAVVFGDEARDGPTIDEVVQRLRRAGFADVRRVGRVAPSELSALARSGAPPIVAEQRASTSTLPTRTPAGSASSASSSGASRSTLAPPAPERAPAVSLASVGLHVDGVLDREPHRTRLVRVFEREFNAFRRCHVRAERHAEGASFGVDLLIPKAGGRGKVRQIRTRLDSKPFRACMQAAFESIRFAPPPSGRPEIVSYSVLFKPNAR